MSKEMEALKDLIKRNNAIREEGHFHIGTDTINIIKKALTPPTAEEVCEALKSYFGHHVDKIFYDNESKSFRDEINPNLVEYLFDITYLKDIPPSLITLIGRFYEGLEK